MDQKLARDRCTPFMALVFFYSPRWRLLGFTPPSMRCVNAPEGPNMFKPLRFWFMLAVLGVATISLHLLSHGEPVMPSHPLASLPMAIGAWDGRELPIEQRLLDAVGVDDHVSRAYLDHQN